MGPYYLTQDQIDMLNNSMPASQVVGLGTLLDQSLGLVSAGGVMFDETATIVPTAAGTGVTLLPDSRVGASQIVKLWGFTLRVNGSTAVSGGSFTKLFITDSAATSQSLIDFAVANLTANAILRANSTGVTYQDNGADVGATQGYGLRIIGDANAGAGSNLIVRAWGLIQNV